MSIVCHSVHTLTGEQVYISSFDLHLPVEEVYAKVRLLKKKQ